MPKKLSNYEITKRAEEIIYKGGVTLTASDDEMPECMFFVGAKDYFCKATTCKSCKGCRFYKPDIFRRRRILVEEIDKLEAIKDANDITIKEQIRMIQKQQELIQNAEIQQMEISREIFNLRRDISALRPAAAIGKSVTRNRKKRTTRKDKK